MSRPVVVAHGRVAVAGRWLRKRETKPFMRPPFVLRREDAAVVAEILDRPLPRCANGLTQPALPGGRRFLGMQTPLRESRRRRG